VAKIEEARAIRYLIDALEDKAAVALLLQGELFGAAVFHCQQLCEKGIKACLSLVGVFAAADHRVSDLFVEHVLPRMEEKLKREPT